MDQNNIQNERYLRWIRNERIQHWILACSFIVLVITGFALKYPDAWWVRPFIGSDFVFNLRGLLHRIAGSAFIGLGIYHIGYLLLTRRGRSQIKALCPRIQDLRDALQNFAFNLGLSKRRPRFGHYSYIEKVEYWALVWGALIMSGTGFMLWFEELTLTLFPKWVIDLLTVIHLYEAWLATLAIVVWHFYMVLFKPEIYPIDLSMITGEISEEMLREEHFLEYMQMQEGTREIPYEESI
ncbi:MAG: formate dehydrogenase subunit gamma [bacterium]